MSKKTEGGMRVIKYYMSKMGVYYNNVYTNKVKIAIIYKTESAIPKLEEVPEDAGSGVLPTLNWIFLKYVAVSTGVA
jgi:hypothetical protein